MTASGASSRAEPPTLHFFSLTTTGGRLYPSMNALSKHKVAFAFALAAAAAPSAAFADELQGPKGSVAELEINHSTSDKYLQQHGRVVIVTGKQSAEYRWGGVACGSRTLTENLTTMLQRALESGTPIVPRYQPGQGPALCLVGFTLSP